MVPSSITAHLNQWQLHVRLPCSGLTSRSRRTASPPLNSALGCMNFFAPPTTCPYCAKPVALAALRSIPHSGRLKWYQFTPAPQTACPNCGGLVRNAAHNSSWLWLVIASFVIGGVSLVVVPLNFLLRGYVWAIPAVIGILFAIKSNRLVPVSPPPPPNAT
jgi:hypothetical protein